MGNSLTFGPVNSSDFDVVISGEGVFDAPKKDVEKVSIPGRNGDLIIDRNRYENITVSYPAYYYKPNMFDFRSVLDNFRSALASQRGYQRLEDTFHPDEFRLGMFADGFEVDPVKYNTAARFNIDFDCKPQRFLKSGEVPQEFDADGSIYNPTHYEAAPLLAVEGRGEIVLNGYPIEINTDPLGKLPLFADKDRQRSTSQGVTTDTEYGLFGNVPYTAGDQIEVYQSSFMVEYAPPSGGYFVSASVSSETNVKAFEPVINSYLLFQITLAKQTFTEGTAKTVTGSATFSVVSKNSSNQDVAENITINVSLKYDPQAGRYIAASVSASDGYVTLSNLSPHIGDGYIYSTKTALNEKLYIDCELGEAYVGDQSYNNAVSLGANLPRLSPGANTFTLANTIDKLTIIPRWWRI